MCTLNSRSSANSSTGQSLASQSAPRPSAKHQTCDRVTTIEPTLSRGPSRAIDAP